MAVDDLFIPDGVYLKCDQGATVVNLKVNFKKHKLYGEIIATEKDHTPLVNIPSFGACSSTGSACTPTDTYWVNVHEGGTLVQKQKPLLETSFCKCMKGGNIKIFFSEAEAIAGLEADKNERVDKIPYIDAILGKATLGPLNPLFLFTDTEPSDVGRGVRKGIKSTYHGLKQMILHPIDTAKGLGKLAMTGVAGYVPPMTSASFGGIPTESEIKMQQDWFDKTPEQRIADFDKDMGTDLTSTHEGIKAAASEFYDQKIVHGTNAERGVLMGQTAEFIGELVIGSKGAGAVIKSAKGSAVVASASEKLSIAIATINEFVKATKLGKLAKSIKGIFKVGRRHIFLSTDVFEKIIWGERVLPGNRLIGGHSGKISNLHPNYAVEELGYSSVNSNCRRIKFVTQYPDGKLSKIKSSTLFPDNWSSSKIKNAIENIANDNSIPMTTQGTGTSYKIGTYQGVKIQVTYDNAGKITGGFPL
ncbi:DUF4280 domain-containing protein [Apibacter muscae]|uniref:PAAR-like protein n=1 Tax=Apibacter muscae TaxID=2509004 RepID=UPI0011ABB2DD|nr:PAAR-like protein [Apibacter muscae]TWP29374.1 DUF4280 domain-containing protein [Apibacter muscae]